MKNTSNHNHYKGDGKNRQTATKTANQTSVNVSTDAQLRKAIANTQNGKTKTIILTSAITITDEVININRGINIIIQSHRKKRFELTRKTGPARHFNITNGASLTLESVIIQSQEGTAKVPATTLRGGISVSGCESKLIIDGAVIKNNKGLDTCKVPTVNVTDGALFTMKNGSIEYNSAVASVGVSNANFTLIGGYIQRNRPTGLSLNGNVQISNDSIFNMRGGEINNLRGELGGGVFVRDSTFNLIGGKIHNNSANLSGCGVYLRNGTFNMKNGTICDNYLTQREGKGTVFGGGIGAVDNSTLDIQGGLISNNKADDGAGIYLDSTVHLIIGNAEISNNEAKNSGGGIYTTATTFANLTIYEKATFANNKASNAVNLPANLIACFSNIKTTSSSIYNNPINNFDINALMPFL